MDENSSARCSQAAALAANIVLIPIEGSARRYRPLECRSEKGAPAANRDAPSSRSNCSNDAIVTDRPVAGNTESRLLYRFPDLKRLGIVNN